MKKTWIPAMVLFLGGFLEAAQEKDLEIWEEFVTLLENNQMTVERIKGEYAPNEQLLEWNKAIKSRNSYEEMVSDPEIFRVENKVTQFL